MIKHYEKLLLVGAVFLLLFSVCAKSGTDGVDKEIVVVFRFDDPSAKSNTEIEEKLITAFGRYNARCTFGVIPFVSAGVIHDSSPQDLLPLSLAKIEMLRQAAQEGVIEIAQHGYSHQTNGLRKDGYSEFAGLGYEEQLRRVKKGKQFLEAEFGNPVTIFIPPWNTYDANTVTVLEQQGFQCLSADTRGTVDGSNSLLFLPATFSITQIQDAVLSSREVADQTPVIVVLFHEYDFREVSESRGKVTFEEFIQTLKWLSVQEDVSIKLVGQVKKMSREQYLENQIILRASTLLPAFMCGRWSPGIFLSSAGIRDVKAICYVLICMFYITVLLISSVLSFLLGSILFSKVYIISRLSLPLGVILLVAGSVHVFHDLKFGLAGLGSTVAVIGYCVGICVANFWYKRRVLMEQ